MEIARCLRIAPLVALTALGAVGLARPPAMVAGGSGWSPPPCPASAGALSAEGTSARGEPGPWFRLRPVLDRTGTLAGRRLVVGSPGGQARTMTLPPESFATGPVGGHVLVGTDDGRTSRLRLLDVATGCTADVAAEAAVIRSAIAVPGQPAVLEHRVDRGTRADLGVWRRPLDGGEPVRVLGPLPVDDRYGPTFTTDLRLAADGRLVVTGCGQRACRARVADGSDVRRTGAPTGPALGVHGTAVIARDACAGLPCAVVSVDLETGLRRVLVDATGPAALGGPGDRYLTYEDADGRTAVLDLESGAVTRVSRTPLHPIDGGSVADAGAEARGGAIPLAAGADPADGIRILALDGPAPILEVIP